MALPLALHAVSVCHLLRAWHRQFLLGVWYWRFLLCLCYCDMQGSTSHSCQLFPIKATSALLSRHLYPHHNFVAIVYVHTGACSASVSLWCPQVDCMS